MFEIPSPIEKIKNFNDFNTTLLLKRDDKIHDQVSGNKYRKLKYNVLENNDLGEKIFVTKGGAYSNHIHAIALAAKFATVPIIGFIRGEKIENETLAFAQRNGMQLIFVSRNEYRSIDEHNFQDFLPQKLSNAVFIPEGGTNLPAIKGVKEIIPEIQAQLGYLPDYICTPCGSLGTMLGLVEGLEGKSKVLGFSALKGGDLSTEFEEKQSSLGLKAYTNWRIFSEYHFGGYAKTTTELFDFIRMFKKENGVLLDPIYTSKMLFGIYNLIENGFFIENSTILVIHTGGVQGWNGFPNIVI